MAYALDLSGAIWRVNCSGTFTGDDLVRLADDADKVESGRASLPNRLTDLRGVTTVNLRFDDMQQFVRKRQAKIFPNDLKSAVIATDALHHGFARMFQTLLDHPQIAVRIFRNEPEALAWLSSAGE